MSFEEAMAQFLPQIEAEMHSVMEPSGREMDLFYGMMHYHLGWCDANLNEVKIPAGKRLRPMFTLLSCRAAGGEPERALPAAAAVELVHNFSLIHDDIQDASDTRRGRPTVWNIWGEPQAINSGDAMFVLARNAMLRLQNRDVWPGTVLRAVDRLDRTCLTLCRGQYLDMSFERTLDVDLSAYLEMIEAKTAALLACAGFLGGLVATEDAGAAEVYWRLGRALGLAFQIQDDLLGVWGDEDITGKPGADDLRRRKKSLPVVFALNQPETAETTRFRQIYSMPSSTEAEIAEAVDLLEAAGAKDYTESLAKDYVEQAQSALAAIDAMEEDKLPLQEMADFLIERAY